MDCSFLQGAISSKPCVRRASTSLRSLDPAGNCSARRRSNSGETASGLPARSCEYSGVSGGQAPHQPPPAVTFLSNGGSDGFDPGHPDIAANTPTPPMTQPTKMSPIERMKVRIATVHLVNGEETRDVVVEVVGISRRPIRPITWYRKARIAQDCAREGIAILKEGVIRDVH
jgi:hypothetical protein